MICKNKLIRLGIRAIDPAIKLCWNCVKFDFSNMFLTCYCMFFYVFPKTSSIVTYWTSPYKVTFVYLAF